MSYARTYNGHDADVTEALSTYVYFRDDARMGGWQAYLPAQRRLHPLLLSHAHLRTAEFSWRSR